MSGDRYFKVTGVDPLGNRHSSSTDDLTKALATLQTLIKGTVWLCQRSRANRVHIRRKGYKHFTDRPNINWLSDRRRHPYGR